MISSSVSGGFGLHRFAAPNRARKACDEYTISVWRKTGPAAHPSFDPEPGQKMGIADNMAPAKGGHKAGQGVQA